MLLLTKGLIPPRGQLPAEYVGERVRARAIACLGGPAHAREAVSGSAALVLGSADADLRAQLGEVFDRAGLVCERSGDVTGVEMAGAAKNAAALAAAAAEPHGLNAAGIAAAEVWRECTGYAIERGAELETFSGLAGVGDLTATVMAPTGRNRRAGELLGQRHPRGGDPRPDRPGLRGARRGAAAGRGDRRRRLPRRGARRPRRADPRRDRRRGLDHRPAPGRALEEGGMSAGRAAALGLRAMAESFEPASLDPAAKAELDRAFEELYRTHLRDVYSYAYYRVGNPHDAEDLTEQAFLQAYRHFDRARRESDGRPLRPWLIRIAHNLASNYYRDRARRPQTPLDDADPIAARHGTEAIAEGREELRQVMDNLQHLPDDRREALIMRFALGMDNREIARALGRTDGATKVLIHRAIKQLQEEMGVDDD